MKDTPGPRWLTFTPLILVLALLAAACGEAVIEGTTSDTTSSPGETAPDETAPDETAAKPTLRIALSEFGTGTLDPAVESRSPAANIILAMYDTLLEIAPDGGILPGLATDWESSADGTSWTFHLRDDVRFHNGEELSADDVKFSIERYMNESASSGVTDLLIAAVGSVVVVDDYTVQINTNGVQVGLPLMLSPHQTAPAILPADYVLQEAGDDFVAQTQLLTDAPVGSGTFRFVSRAAGDSVVLESVDEHWRTVPQVGRLEFLLVEEPATQLAMLRSGEADIISVTGDQASELEDSGFEIRTIDNANTVAVKVVGTWRPVAEGKPTADARVRKAMSLAINRQEIIDTLMSGYATLPTTPWNTFTGSADVDVSHFSEWANEIAAYDPDEARALLADAGYPDGFSGFTLHTYPRAEGPYLPDLAQIIQAQWAQVGIIAEIEVVDFGEYRTHLVDADPLDEYNAADPMTYAVGTRYDSLGPLNSFYRYEGGHVQLMADPELDALMDELAAELDPERRIEIANAAWDRVNDAWITLSLFNAQQVYAVNPETVGDWQVFDAWGYLGRMAEHIEPA